MIEKVTLKLPNNNYDILIGQNSTTKLEEFLKSTKYSKIFIVTDQNVANYHLSYIQNIVDKTGVDYSSIVTEVGEKVKSFQHLEKLTDEIISKGVDRKSLIIAFGGGVIGDLSGFAASILMRGIDFVQVPTTLLAMVDSSVGGKTAVNSSLGKNLIGSFYQPKLVICDTRYLKTLPTREFLSGYAEVVKYGFIENKEFFDYLRENHEQIFNSSEDELKYIIKESCKSKAEIVSQDEREGGVRALLNFGHTFGHIFETEAHYSSKILHGEAVAIGMAMAARMSVNLGFLGQDECDEIVSYLKECAFILDVEEFGFKYERSNLIQHLFKDKKVENKKLTFILLKKIGQAFIEKDVDILAFEKVLDEYL